MQMNKYNLFLFTFLGAILVSLSFVLLIDKSSKVAMYNNTLQHDINPPRMQPLLWESKIPESRFWSQHLFSEIQENFDILDKASDMDYFCPNYALLQKSEKINVWGQLIASMAYFESGFKLSARYVEPMSEVDPVTKLPVVSEGLLQLGYSDVLYHGCEFDWSNDSKLSPEDINKTIFDPYLNLSCGIKILTKQIKKHGAICINRGAYWAVIKIGHRNVKIEKIKNIITGYKMCKNE